MEVKYVQKDIFDEEIRNVNSRADYDRERTDDKLDKLQAIMEKNMAEVKAMFVEVRGEIKRLDSKIDKVEDTLSIAIMGLTDRFEDMKDYQNKWFTVFGVLLGVLTVAFSVLAFFK